MDSSFSVAYFANQQLTSNEGTNSKVITNECFDAAIKLPGNNVGSILAIHIYVEILCFFTLNLYITFIYMFWIKIPSLSSGTRRLRVPPPFKEPGLGQGW